MNEKIFLGGHRGLGGTESDFYHARAGDKPVENTIPSIVQAFDAGADYVEIDAMMSRDGIPFVLHSVDPDEHFFGAQKPECFLNEMDFSTIRHFKTGRRRNGDIAELRAMLGFIAQHDPKTLPWAVNIEIKGVQSSGQHYDGDGLINCLAQTVLAAGLSPMRILWSSFCLENVMHMASLLPLSHYGMLFTAPHDIGALYADHPDDLRYRALPFTKEMVEKVTIIWGEQVSSDIPLGYAHPEIASVTEEMLDVMQRYEMGINTWPLREELTPEHMKLYRRVIEQAAQKGVALTIMTDDLAAWKSGC